MQERRYSLTEMNEMRAALRDIIMMPRRNAWPGRTEGEIARMVEDQLRTHLQNGTDPADLAAEQAEVKRVYELWLADIRKSDAERRAG